MRGSRNAAEVEDLQGAIVVRAGARHETDRPDLDLLDAGEGEACRVDFVKSTQGFDAPPRQQARSGAKPIMNSSG